MKDILFNPYLKIFLMLFFWGVGGGGEEAKSPPPPPTASMGATAMLYISKIWDTFSVLSSYFLDVQNRNLALGKQCSQSSDYVRWGEASHAVDDNTSGTYDDRHCTHTQVGDKHPWWMVDLGAMLAVESVTIFNRVDCCSKYQLWLFLYKKSFNIMSVFCSQANIFTFKLGSQYI